MSPEDARHFEENRSPKKMFDPSYKSCTNYIREMAMRTWGFEAPDLGNLVHWANIIDGALYSDPKTAVELGAPAMKLTLVIESSKGSDTVQRIIRMMQTQSLEEIIADAEIQSIFQPLYERHLRSLNVIEERASESGGVITFDLTGQDLEGYNKFIPYYLHPRGVYTVAVRPVFVSGTKISVGSNPWAPIEPTHNLATICERYGGWRPCTGGRDQLGARTKSTKPGASRRKLLRNCGTEWRPKV